MLLGESEQARRDVCIPDARVAVRRDRPGGEISGPVKEDQRIVGRVAVAGALREALIDAVGRQRGG